MTVPVLQEEIIHYYISSQWLYRFFWSPKNFGMHVGFWDNNVHTIDQAVENENKEVLKLAKISSDSYVLDAGCGLGSTSVYIGMHTKAKVIGISLVPKQVQAAQAYAEGKKIGEHVSFLVADFTKMPFADNTFDAIIGIESVCHAYPKEAFLTEAYRVLKKGGRLVIADGYMRVRPRTQEQIQLYDQFCTSFALSELITVDEMQKKISQVKFRQITRIDATQRVVLGTKKLFAKSRALHFMLPVVSHIPFSFARAIVRNAAAAQASMGLLTTGAGWYGIFTAVK